tara:strand:- start:3069 stop:3353 length:285 start_codon:yes stop_codon:yes gene_type:complete
MTDLFLDTSNTAKRSVHINGLEQTVYEVIRGAGPNGLHSDAVRCLLPDLAYSSVTARYRKLLDTGRIYLNGQTRKGASGRAQRVMIADVWSDPI